jgi:prepilin-type N-terminal cleavage/methylation domain-containing protein
MECKTDNDMREKEQMNISAARRPAAAFTLIELLVVIGIIGLLAALITGLAPRASAAQRTKLVQAQKQALMTMIEAYKDKLGSYPIDNAWNTQSTPDHREAARTNLLFYELTGALYTNNVYKNNLPGYRALNDANLIYAFNLTNYMGYGAGVGNSVNPENFYGSLTPRTSASRSGEPYKPIPGSNAHDPRKDSSSPMAGVMVLVVPVNLDFYQDGTSTPANYVNSWYYDCSSTNRHNPETYDLWGVYNIGKRVVTNGNWND